MTTPDPLILTVAPNGAYKQAADHAGVPLTPTALADTARRCLDAGAAMLHLHIRDAQGRHSLGLVHEYLTAALEKAQAEGRTLTDVVVKALERYVKR